MRLFFATSTLYKRHLLAKGDVKNILFAYPYASAGLLRDFDDYLTKVKDVNLIIDSGAFSAWTLGKEIKREEYLTFIKMMLERYKGKLNDVVVVNLDKIPGTFGQKPTDAQREESAQIGMDNFHYFLANGIKTIPVYHQHEDIKWLKLMEKETDYIGISPANDCSTKVRMVFMDTVYSYLKDRVKTHSFGGISASILKRYPLYSGDSSSWGAYFRWGNGCLSRGTKKPIGNEALEYKTGIEIAELKALERYITKLWASRGVIWE